MQRALRRRFAESARTWGGWLAGALALACGGADGAPPPRFAPVLEARSAAQTDSGSILVQVRDDRGRPVAGVELRLLPRAPEGTAYGEDWARVDPSRRLENAPQLDSRALVDAHERIRWSTTSDVQGLARFDGLPAGEPFRVGVLSSTSPRLTPPHEAPLVDAWSDAPRPPAHLSGLLVIVAQAEQRVDVVVPRPALVRGRLSLCAERPLGSVVVYAVDCLSSDPRPSGLLRVIEEGRAQIQPDGRFQSPPLSPGPKLLRASWYEEARCVRFAGLEFELRAGQELRLGALEPGAFDAELEVRVGVRAADGSALRAAEVFAAAEGAYALLSVHAGLPLNDPGRSVFEQFLVPVDESVRLVGLPAGSAALTARPYLHPAAAPRRSDQRLGPSEQHTLSLPESGELELQLHLSHRSRARTESE